MPKAENRNFHKAVCYWTLTLTYMGIIFFLSSRHGFHLPRVPVHFDKIIHMGIYVPLAFLLYLSLKKSGITQYVFFVSFFFAIIYGVSDELHQLLVPGRHAAVGDVVADSIGAFLGSLGASFLRN